MEEPVDPSRRLLLPLCVLTIDPAQQIKAHREEKKSKAYLTATQSSGHTSCKPFGISGMNNTARDHQEKLLGVLAG